MISAVRVMAARVHPRGRRTGTIFDCMRSMSRLSVCARECDAGHCYRHILAETQCMGRFQQR